VDHGHHPGEIVSVDASLDDFDVVDAPLVAATPRCLSYAQDRMDQPLTVAAGTAVASYAVRFQGHRIVTAALDQLLDPAGTFADNDPLVSLPSLANATRVVVGGDSAGSGGARLHAETIADVLTVEPKFVLDAAVGPSREREDVNGPADSCDLYGDLATGDPFEPADFTTPNDTYDVIIADMFVGVGVDVWSAFGGPASCRSAHETPEGLALPLEVCNDPHHVAAEHFEWDLFERQEQDDATGRPDRPPTDCAANPAVKEEWADLVAEHFDAFHAYLDGDRNWYDVAWARRVAGVSTVCVTTTHAYVPGDAVTVRVVGAPDFDMNATSLTGVRGRCLQYDQDGSPDVAWLRTSGWTRASLVTVSGEPGIETGKLWYLGQGDAAGNTGIPFVDVPFFQSFSPLCGKHDAVLDSSTYFYEELADPTDPTITYTFREAVEDFVSEARVVPKQLQDDWQMGRPGGLVCAHP
jgi:hypothetical protein